MRPAPPASRRLLGSARLVPCLLLAACGLRACEPAVDLTSSREPAPPPRPLGPLAGAQAAPIPEGADPDPSLALVAPDEPLVVVASEKGIRLVDAEGKPTRLLSTTPATSPRFVPGTGRRQIVFLAAPRARTLELRQLWIASGLERRLAPILTRLPLPASCRAPREGYVLLPADPDGLVIAAGDDPALPLAGALARVTLVDSLGDPAARVRLVLRLLDGSERSRELLVRAPGACEASARLDEGGDAGVIDWDTPPAEPPAEPPRDRARLVAEASPPPLRYRVDRQRLLRTDDKGVERLHSELPAHDRFQPSPSGRFQLLDRVALDAEADLARLHLTVLDRRTSQLLLIDPTCIGERFDPSEADRIEHPGPEAIDISDGREVRWVPGADLLVIGDRIVDPAANAPRLAPLDGEIAR